MATSCISVSMSDRITVLSMRAHSWGRWAQLTAAGFVAVVLVSGCGQPADAFDATPGKFDFSADSTRIMERMAFQEAAWSSGDVEGFMSAYWRSDSLLFVGSRGPSFGWQTTLDNYRTSYPTADAMGALTFEVKDVQPAGTDYALMLGAWRLERPAGRDTLSGWFSLVWQRMDGDWVIVRDHSS